MKTIHLNLASKPYRNFRVHYAVFGTATIAALVLMGYNALTAYRYLVDTRDTRQEIAAIEAETAHERETADSMERRIGAIDAASLDRQARFINVQIRERAFSWSGMMSDLESLLPADVRLTRLNPAVTEAGEVTLALDCVSRREDGLVVMLDRLYANPKFKNTFPQSDSAQTDGTHRLNIQTTYLPRPEEATE